MEQQRNRAGQRQAGDWTARTGLVHRSDAMGQLAEKLDELAEHGQRTSRAFRTLSSGNRTLLRESDEPRLLKEMCRVAVEQGGYALAFVNYAQHDAEKSQGGGGTVGWVVACEPDERRDCNDEN